MNVTAVCVVCVSAAVLSVMLKQYKPEYALIVSVVSGAVTLLVCLAAVMPLLDKLRESIGSLGNCEYCISILIKSLGICYITQFASDACSDCGEKSLANKIEIAAKVSIALLALPLVEQIIGIAQKMTES